MARHGVARHGMARRGKARQGEARQGKAWFFMSSDLRPYQLRAFEDIRAEFRRGIKSVLLQMPTGAGKTVVVAQMVASAAKKGKRIWFIVHRRELIRQSMEALNNEAVPFAVCAAGFNENCNHPIQIASVQTLARRVDRLAKPDLIIWDECHHAAARTWAELFNRFGRAHHIGLSATPERLDGTGLNQFFQRIVCGPSVRELIEQAYLADYRLFAPSRPKVESLHVSMGDYRQSETVELMDKPRITGDALDHYQKYAAGKRALIFAASVEHSQHVVDQFSRAGLRAAHVDGNTDSDLRDRLVRDFTEHRLDVLSNVDLFGEGFDLPALECVIMLRPTMSTAMYLQQCGRALRPSEGKREALILDHAGNSHRHGLPDDERQWTLDGRVSTRRDSDGPAIRQCPNCLATVFAYASSCRHCNYEFPVKARVVEHVEGELSEVDQKVVRMAAKREQATAGTEAELIALGRARGYKRPELWARHVFMARRRHARI